MTKATKKEKGEPRFSQNWVVSRRGFIKFFNTYMSLGDWKFEFDQIENPIMYKAKGLLLSGKILTFEYKSKSFQFGLNPWTDPLPHLPIKVKTEKIKLKYSPFSIVLRILILGYIGYLVFSKLY